MRPQDQSWSMGGWGGHTDLPFLLPPGHANASFCPHGYGCRALVVCEGQALLDVTDSELTVTVRVPDGRWLWLVSPRLPRLCAEHSGPDTELAFRGVDILTLPRDEPSSHLSCHRPLSPGASPVCLGPALCQAPGSSSRQGPPGRAVRLQCGAST